LTAQRGSLSARVGVIGVELAGLQAQVAQLESVIREVQDREQGLVEVRGSVRALPLADVRGWAGVRQRRCEGLVVSVDDRLRAAVLAVERVLVDLWRQHSLVSGQIDDLNAERRALNASLSSVVAELGRLS
jgi:prefoldin subunit 5